MKELAQYHHYIYCRDCKVMNEPIPLKITYEAFRRKVVYRWLTIEDKEKVCKGTYPKERLQEKYDEFDACNMNPGDFFDSNGLKCISCGSINIEVKILEK